MQNTKSDIPTVELRPFVPYVWYRSKSYIDEQNPSLHHSSNDSKILSSKEPTFSSIATAKKEKIDDSAKSNTSQLKRSPLTQSQETTSKHVRHVHNKVIVNQNDGLRHKLSFLQNAAVYGKSTLPHPQSATQNDIIESWVNMQLAPLVSRNTSVMGPYLERPGHFIADKSPLMPRLSMNPHVVLPNIGTHVHKYRGLIRQSFPLPPSLDKEPEEINRLYRPTVGEQSLMKGKRESKIPLPVFKPLKPKEKKVLIPFDYLEGYLSPSEDEDEDDDQKEDENSTNGKNVHDEETKDHIEIENINSLGDSNILGKVESKSVSGDGDSVEKIEDNFDEDIQNDNQSISVVESPQDEFIDSNVSHDLEDIPESSIEVDIDLEQTSEDNKIIDLVSRDNFSMTIELEPVIEEEI